MAATLTNRVRTTAMLVIASSAVAGIAVAVLGALEIKVAIVRAKQRVERTLQVSQARFQEVFDSAALGIVITDLTVATPDALSSAPGEWGPTTLASIGMTTSAPVMAIEPSRQ